LQSRTIAKMDETRERSIGNRPPIVGRALCYRAGIEVHLLWVEHRGRDPVGSAGALVISQSRGLDFADLISEQRDRGSLVEYARVAVNANS